MKLWLDDVRDPPDASWTWARGVDEAIALLATGEVVEASLDHDLGAWDDGRPVARYIVGMANPPRMIHVHSMNPAGAAALRAILAERARE